MRRTIEYRIPETGQCSVSGQNSATGQILTIKHYLKAKGYSSRSLIELKKHPAGVTVNGKPVFLTHRLLPGDLLTIHIAEEESSEKILPVELPLDIVYEDADLLVLNKPAGMPIHPSMHNYDNSVANALAWYFSRQGIPFVFRCINRLDRDTSGLTLIAKHYVSAGILSAMVAAKGCAGSASPIGSGSYAGPDSGISREYLAIVRGHLTPPQGVITAPLSRKPGSIIERTVDFAHGERAVTHYALAEERNGHSLVSLRLETGRTHQIRIHMKYLGYPLIGDYLYNPDMEYISRQALHSHRLTFSHPITGRLMEFTAPLPRDMAQVLEGCTS